MRGKRSSATSQIWFPIAALIALSLSMSYWGQSQAAAGAPAKPIEIAFQSAHPRAQYVSQKLMIPWAKRLEERSGGRLKVTYYDPAAVVPQEKVMEAVSANTLQMGVTFPFVPGEQPFVRILSLPLIAPSGTILAMTGQHLYQTIPQWRAQFPKEVVVLFHGSGAMMQLHTVRKAVTKLEDMAGLKIIASTSDWIPVVQALGAIPLNILIYDAYQALERGMADGGLLPLAPVRAMKVAEVAKHTTVANLGSGLFTIVMNRATFDALPKDLQQLILSESGEKMSEAFGRALDDGSLEDAQWMKDRGNQFHILTPEERARWVERLIPVRERYLNELQAKGMPARKIYEEAVRWVDKLVAEGKFIPRY